MRSLAKFLLFVLLLTGGSLAHRLAAQSYDVGGDFSATHNPNSVWQYGYSATVSLDPSQFQLDQSSVVNTDGVDFWHPTSDDASSSGTGYYPYFAVNTTSASTADPTDSWAVRPHEAAMEANNDGRYSLVRFVAPQAGYYQVNATFEGIHFRLSTTDVHILDNGTQVFDDEISGYGGDPAFHQVQGANPSTSYSGILSLQTGDTVTFAVGIGTDGTNYNDTTGLMAHITYIPVQPVFHLYYPGNDDHLYTASASERTTLLSQNWQDEGILGYAPGALSGLDAVYRLFDPPPGGDYQHVLSISGSEIQSLESSGWQGEAVEFSSYAASSPGLLPLFRLHNPYDNTYYCTVSQSDHDYWVTHGLTDTGILGYLNAPAGELQPVFELFLAGSDDHLCTADPAERGSLLAQGWQDEGILGYAPGAGAVGTEAVYRLFDPAGAYQHVLSTSDADRASFTASGWSGEGVKFYAYAASGTGLVPLYRLHNPNDNTYYLTTSQSDHDYWVTHGLTDAGTLGYLSGTATH